MEALNATISKVSGAAADRLPKNLSEWAVPAAATAALIVGLNLVWASNKEKEKSPPVVLSWIPWIGSQWAIDWDPDAFMKSAQLSGLGGFNDSEMQSFPGGIFGAKTTGRTMYYVTDAALINQVYKQPKIFAMSLVQMEWGKNCFSFSDKALFGTPALTGEIFPHLDRSMAPVNMMGLVETFERCLAKAIKTFPTPTPGTSVSLQDFVLRLAHRATGAAYYGPTFDVEAFWDDWQGFDDGVYKVALAYPVPLCPHFVKCRERVIQRFLEYLDDPAHEPCEMIGEQERMARDVAKLDRRDLGVLIMSDYWPLMANVPWGSLWLLILQLQRAEGLAPILAELDAAGAAWSSTQPDPTVSYLSNLTAFFQSQPQLPLFQSTINEVLRFTSDSYSMRGVVPDEGAMLGGYKLKKNDTLIMSTRSVHFDETLFGEDAKTFEPKRWLNLGEEAKTSFRPYGGGVSMCSGRHFASYHVKIFLTTLLHSFRFEVDKAKSPGPSPREQRVWAEAAPRGIMGQDYQNLMLSSASEVYISHTVFAPREVNTFLMEQYRVPHSGPIEPLRSAHRNHNLNCQQRDSSPLLKDLEMPARLPEKLNTLPAVPNRFGDDGGKFYSYYDEVADELDDTMVASLKAQLDGILIFSGLFAAVVSGLLTLTLPQLSADAADDTNALLFQIILGANGTIKSPEDLPSASFSPPQGLLQINILFSVSLTLALLTSFLAVLGQQWLVYYRKRSGGGPESQRWEQLRRYLGAKRWKLELVLDDILPSMIQIALVIFCVGLALYLSKLSITLLYAIMVPIGIIGGMIAAMAIFSGWDRWCPFHTPLSNVAQVVLQSLFWLGRTILPIPAAYVHTGLIWLLGKQGLLDFKTVVKSRTKTITDRIHAHQTTAPIVQGELELIAVKRVLSKSEDPAALVYAAVNLRCVRESQLLARRMLRDDDFRDRFQGLYCLDYPTTIDSEVVQDWVLTSSWFYVILSAGDVEDFLSQNDRDSLRIQVSGDPATMLMSRLRRRLEVFDDYPLRPDVKTAFSSHPLVSCMFLVGRMVSPSKLWALTADGSCITSSRPTGAAPLLFGTAWMEAWFITMSQEWHKHYGRAGALESNAWRLRKLREFLHTYQTIDHPLVTRILGEAIATADPQVQWTRKPQPEIYLKLFDEFRDLVHACNVYNDYQLTKAILKAFLVQPNLIGARSYDPGTSQREHQNAVTEDFARYLEMRFQGYHGHNYSDMWLMAVEASGTLQNYMRQIQKRMRSDRLDLDMRSQMKLGLLLYDRLPDPQLVRQHGDPFDDDKMQEYEQLHSAVSEIARDIETVLFAAPLPTSKYLTETTSDMPARVIEKLTTLPAIPNKFGEDGGKFYSYYDELADELDDNMVASLKAQLDGILIFAGLFAGVNSAFLAFTLPKMSADAADDTNALLFQIILGSNRTITSPKDLPSASFSPPPGTLSINILFSLSLTLALVSSFLAVLGQQWLVYYRKRSGGGPEFQRWEQLRRYLGAKRWRLELVLDDILPSMLQIALVIFCVAFVLYLAFTWLIYVSKRGTTQFDFKNESKSRAIALTDWIHGLHAKSAKSAQYTNELELIAITRVLNTSEDPAALVYAAMNLQCGLHYFSIEPATDPDSTRTFALASSWYHVILSTGSVEDLLGNDERLLLETHINEPDYTVKLVIQLSQRYSFGPQPSDMFNSNPLTYSMFVIEQIISQDGLRYVFVDGRTTEPPNPTRGNAISYGTAWTEALMIKIVQEWNEQGGFPNPLHRATWQVAKLRDLFYTYRNMYDFVMLL
ncbi:hypothetical protein FRB90_008889 [Tulasnella sp. 427]|nr:hypothetical protein FRB90_008889 [Tulasnella sp. 427]